MKANLRIITVVAACAVLVGSCFAQGQGGRQRGRNGFNSLTSIARRADVQTELKVTDDQKTKLEALAPARGGGRNGGGGGGNGGGAGAGAAGAGAAGGAGRTAPDPAAMAARREAEKKALAEILNPDQMKRLQELLIQREGDRAIASEEVQTALGFSDDQKSKVKALQEKMMSAQRDMMEKVRNGDMDRQAMRDAMTANNKTMGEELHKILTSDQADKLKAMGGAPFKFEDPTPGGGR